MSKEKITLWQTVCPDPEFLYVPIFCCARMENFPKVNLLLGGETFQKGPCLAAGLVSCGQGEADDAIKLIQEIQTGVQMCSNLASPPTPPSPVHFLHKLTPDPWHGSLRIWPPYASWACWSLLLTQLCTNRWSHRMLLTYVSLLVLCKWPSPSLQTQSTLNLLELCEV